MPTNRLWLSAAVGRFFAAPGSFLVRISSSVTLFQMFRRLFLKKKGVKFPAAVRAFASDTGNFTTRPAKLYKLEGGPKAEVSVTKADALHYYEQMQTIRRMETAAGGMYKDKQIRGFCHLYSGQEAVAVGMKASLKPADSVITAYRCHGWSYLMGVQVQQVLSELAGKVSGVVHGKGGSMHMYGDNFFGGNGIVGAQQPLGAGIALAAKYKGENGLCVTLYGDGAANQGQLFEALNMAKLWNLPCIFVCENNGYGMGTSAERSSANTEYYTRGDYVPGIWVDAMDILAVREATNWAAEYVRGGNGPLMMEMATYRYSGHSMSDPGTSYRTREEIQEVRKSRDPITGFKDKLISANLCTEEELKEVEKKVRKQVDEAVNIALKDAEPPLELTYTDVYKDTPDQLIRGPTVDQIIRPVAQTSIEALNILGKKTHQVAQ